jgi:hypothetical protein
LFSDFHNEKENALTVEDMDMTNACNMRVDLSVLLLKRLIFLLKPSLTKFFKSY